MNFNKIKPISIRILSFLILIFFVVHLIMMYTDMKTQGNRSTFSAFISIIIRKKTYIILILTLLGNIGPFIKKRIGWIFTALLYYIITIPILFYYNTIDLSFGGITIYILILGLLIYSIWVLNTNNFMLYYKIKKQKNTVLINNLITISVSLLLAVILYLTNVR